MNTLTRNIVITGKNKDNAFISYFDTDISLKNDVIIMFSSLLLEGIMVIMCDWISVLGIIVIKLELSLLMFLFVSCSCITDIDLTKN